MQQCILLKFLLLMTIVTVGCSAPSTCEPADLQPGSLTAEIGDGFIILTWDPYPSIDCIDKYSVSVFGVTDDGELELLDTLEIAERNTMGVAVEDLENGLKYLAVVTAYNQFGSGLQQVEAIPGVQIEEAGQAVFAGEFLLQEDQGTPPELPGPDSQFPPLLLDDTTPASQSLSPTPIPSPNPSPPPSLPPSTPSPSPFPPSPSPPSLSPPSPSPPSPMPPPPSPTPSPSPSPRPIPSPTPSFSPPPSPIESPPPPPPPSPSPPSPAEVEDSERIVMVPIIVASPRPSPSPVLTPSIVRTTPRIQSPLSIASTVASSVQIDSSLPVVSSVRVRCASRKCCISWTSNAQGVDYFVIASEKREKLGTLLTTETGLVDYSAGLKFASASQNCIDWDGLRTGTQYRFKVVAANENDFGLPSSWGVVARTRSFTSTFYGDNCGCGQAPLASVSGFDLTAFKDAFP